MNFVKKTIWIVSEAECPWLSEGLFFRSSRWRRIETIQKQGDNGISDKCYEFHKNLKHNFLTGKLTEILNCRTWNNVIIGKQDIWNRDLFEFDWECLSGCPPGFDCSNDKIEICQSGASFNGGCALCPTGFICEPGKYPRPCPLGQYVSTTKSDRKITWGSQEQADQSMGNIIDWTVRWSLTRTSILRLFMNVRTVHMGINVVLQHLKLFLVPSKSTIVISIRLLVKNAIHTLVNTVLRVQEILKNPNFYIQIVQFS